MVVSQLHSTRHLQTMSLCLFAKLILPDRVNPPCAKVFACGENACTAQRRRRPEGRSFRVVNIQIDLALHKKPWNFNGSRVFLFALNCKILVHCRPGGVLNLIFCISANHIFDAIACQKFILDVCHLCNKEPGISKRGDVILHSPFIMWKKFKHEYLSLIHI